MREVVRAIEKNSDRLDKIRRTLGKEELLAGAAEEAGEVVQALLKYRRSLNGANPTDLPPFLADENLQEELADLLLYAVVFGLDDGLMAETIYKKVNRWYTRLGLD